ncbi:unnamed protein product, partial [Brassica oleracea var. botrytis]
PVPPRQENRRHRLHRSRSPGLNPTPRSTRNTRERTGTSHRTQASPRIFTVTNLRKRNIAQTASRHCFPHAAPIHSSQGRSHIPAPTEDAPKDVNLTILSANQNFIDTLISFKGKKFHGTFVYGELEISKRLNSPVTTRISRCRHAISAWSKNFHINSRKLIVETKEALDAALSA